MFFRDPNCKHVLEDQPSLQIKTSDPLVSPPTIHRLRRLEIDEIEVSTPSLSDAMEDQRMKRAISKRQTTENHNGGSTVTAESLNQENKTPMTPNYENYTYPNGLIEEEDENTTVTFYVFRDGEWDMNLTEAFPLFHKESRVPDDLEPFVKSVNEHSFFL